MNTYQLKELFKVLNQSGNRRMNLYILLEDTNARISLGNRWLVYDVDDGWTVYEHKPYAKKTKILIQTDREEDAIIKLVNQ